MDTGKMNTLPWHASAVALLFALTHIPATTAADYADTHWGKTVDGLKAGVRLEPIDRTEFHPGEMLNLVMEFDVELNHRLRLPRAALWEYAQVHVVSPDGQECIWDQGGTLREDAQIKIDPDDWEWFNDADEQPHAAQIRLAPAKRIWLDAKADKAIPFSLTVPGTYRAWIECKIVAKKNPPKNAWQGTVKSGEAVWTMTELPVENRLNEVTDQQQLEVDAWLALAKLKNREPLSEPLTNTLTQETLLAKNEGLAQRLVEITKNHQASALPILLPRVGSINDGQTGIDGPYLKQLAEYILEIEQQSENQKAETDQSRSSATFDPVILYLRYHPDDADIHHRAVVALSRMARLGTSLTANVQWSSVPYAWAALQELGELKTDMTRQQAEELLGPPDDLSANRFPFGNNLGGGGGFGGGGGGYSGGAHPADQAKAAAAKQSKDPEELQWTRPMLPWHENSLPAILKAQLKDGKTTVWKIQWPGEFRGKIPYGIPGANPE